MRLFVLNFEQDIGKVLCDEMSRHLLDMESLLDSYTTNGELNPILLDTMEIYSEIVKKIFGSALIHNWVKVKISVPHWKKAVQEYDVEVKKEVKARKLLIDLKCILSRIEIIVRDLKEFLTRHNLEATQEEMEVFTRDVRHLVMPQAIEREFQTLRQRIEHRMAAQEVEVEVEREVEQPRLRMVMRY
jgi:hypothetical protein